MSTSLLKSRPTGPIDPFTTDDTPLVSVKIQGIETDLISQYCYDSDILQLGDPFSVNIPDPHGRFDGVVEGLPITLNFASPRVGNGQKVQKITGVITRVRRSANRDRGTVLNVTGADLGWHLVNNDVPIWKRLAGTTFGGLYTKFVDPSWGLQGFADGNDRNVRVKMGGNYQRSTATQGDSDRPPIVQVEPGDKAADYFINFAKLANKLVNVSFDGKLQLFKPRYDTPVAFTFYNYRDKERARKLNNVMQANLVRDLSTRYTKAVCVGTRLIPLASGVDPNDPNANSFRGTYNRPSTITTSSPSLLLAAPGQPQDGLPFSRLTAFADPDRLNSTQAAARAKWKIQRGDFDAWTYEIEVAGHSQGGNFYEPDTMCEVHDEFFGIDGAYYITAVRYDRDEQSGTRSTLTIKLPNLLSA